MYRQNKTKLGSILVGVEKKKKISSKRQRENRDFLNEQIIILKFMRLHYDLKISFRVSKKTVDLFECMMYDKSRSGEHSSKVLSTTQQ